MGRRGLESCDPRAFALRRPWAWFFGPVGPLGLGGGWCGDKGGTPLLRRGGWIGRRQGRDALAAAGWGDADWKVRDPLDVRCPVKARVGGG